MTNQFPLNLTRGTTLFALDFINDRLYYKDAMVKDDIFYINYNTN